MSAAGTPAARAAGLRKSRLPPGGGAPTDQASRRRADRRPTSAAVPPPPRTAPVPASVFDPSLPLSRSAGTSPPRTWTSDLSRLAHGARGTASRPPRRATASLRLHRGTEKADRARDGDHQTGGRDGIGRDTAGVGCGTGPKQGPAGTQPRPCKPAHGATGAPRMARRRPTSDSEAGETFSGMPERPETASAAFCAVLLNRRRETTPGLPRSRPPCPSCHYVDMVP